MSKKDKHREYYLEGKNVTVKKEKLLNQNRGSVSHNSHTTSHNYQKYEIEHQLQDQPTHKKQLLTVKQLKMMIRCCGEYCSFQPQKQSNSQNYKIASKMLKYLRHNFKLVGPTIEVKRYTQLLEHVTPLPERQCQKCEQLGKSCDNYQLQEIQRNLQSDILKLEQQLDQRMSLSEQYMNIWQDKQKKQTKKSNQEQLKHLKQIYDLQMQVLEKQQ